MLRIEVITSIEQAKTYFKKSLSREDYYLDDLESPGLWHGDSARLLRLDGRVGEADYFSLVENQHPNRPGSLTARNRSNRRIGWDIVWDVPKGASVLHALTGDQRIKDLFQAAAQATMKDIEAEIKTRVRKNGRDEDRVTGNAIWASFTHYTARPVGGIPDMQLHQHNVLFNATFDPTEQCWKAVQLGDIKRDAPYFEALYHARVAAGLRELGYSIRRKGRYWDVKHVPDRVIREFSRRTEIVEAAARVLGINSPKAKAKLGATTRESKNHGEGMQDLVTQWRRRISAEETEILTELRFKPDSTHEVSPATALDFALGHCLERESVVSERKLLSEALRYGIGSVGLAELQAEYASRTNIIRREREGQTIVTTREVLREEQQMVDGVVAGRGQLGSLVPGDLHFDLMVFASEEQKRATEYVLKSYDRVIVLGGVSGTGKSSVMIRVAQRVELEGKKMFAFSPGARSAREDQRSLGFEGAETVARLLTNPDLQQQIKSGVVWVDEAGQLSVKQMRALVELVEARNARLILTGDSKQHAPVPRGDALRILEKIGAVQPFELRQIHRQRGRYREIVEALADHQTERAFGMLQDEGWIKEVESEERYRLLAKDYLDYLDDGKTALVVAPTHSEGHDVNKIIRENLRDRGIITGEDQGIWQLRDLHLSDEQKADPAAYEAGQAVRFSQNVRGVVRGSTHEIVEVRDASVLMEDDTGRRRSLPLHHADRFGVYEQDTLWVSTGEQIRINQSGTSKCGRHRLDKGKAYELAGVMENGDLLLGNGWLLDSRYGGVAHPYIQTSHAAQGANVDVVLLAQSGRSYGAGSREQFYVSVGRGREAVRVYTDDADELLAAVTRSSARLTATELVEEMGLEPIQSPSQERAGVRIYEHKREARENWRGDRQQEREHWRQAGFERELGHE